MPLKKCWLLRPLFLSNESRMGKKASAPNIYLRQLCQIPNIHYQLPRKTKTFKTQNFPNFAKRKVEIEWNETPTLYYITLSEKFQK